MRTEAKRASCRAVLHGAWGSFPQAVPLDFTWSARGSLFRADHALTEITKDREPDAA